MGKTKRDLETRVKEHFRNIKIRGSSTYMERKAMDHKPVVLKQASNKLGRSL